jgi:hypothetical protein
MRAPTAIAGVVVTLACLLYAPIFALRTTVPLQRQFDELQAKYDALEDQFLKTPQCRFWNKGLIRQL